MEQVLLILHRKTNKYSSTVGYLWKGDLETIPYPCSADSVFCIGFKSTLVGVPKLRLSYEQQGINWGVTPPCYTDAFTLPSKLTDQANPDSVTRVAKHLLTPCTAVHLQLACFQIPMHRRARTRCVLIMCVCGMPCTMNSSCPRCAGWAL